MTKLHTMNLHLTSLKDPCDCDLIAERTISSRQLELGQVIVAVVGNYTNIIKKNANE